ncbi:FAD-dependent monooxygenase [Sphingomicrobium clamense]|uniref:FAD-dependent monooxygenase n=1 Tax=Sphingomicrobium clamense TaxID=2851013 RepID=A0ABS6V336_9SPHN|nr:FAD-dependent monooxygenase [Sphingomicrobium sp. B8]MBW0143956.1 FAD-dependent monooxygenase [Sphingomicrobium sp. B8]
MSSTDVIILGGGLVGLSLAAALDHSGLDSVVIDPADPTTRNNAKFDGRTSAVSSSSMRMFDVIGVNDHLPEPGCPIRTIESKEGLKPGGLVFDPADDGEPMGWMNENRHLRTALLKRAEAGKRIDLRWQRKPVDVVRDEHRAQVTLDDGSVVTAPLLVGAEGRNSPSREAAGIRMARWQYDHAAIVTTVVHELPHDGVAYEIFYPAGPFAVLPMTDHEDGRHRSAIVWSVPREDAAGYLALTDEEFAAECQGAMGDMLGKVETIAPRSTYPLGFHHAARITDTRLALVGDAAHAIHPIAGQGVNLGYRDVAALTQVLVEGARLGLDLGDRQLLDRYQRWRALDVLSVAMATDGLTRIYGVPGKLASKVRHFGMEMVGKIGPLRDRLMNEARGTSGDLPLLLRGLSI